MLFAAPLFSAAFSSMHFTALLLDSQCEVLMHELLPVASIRAQKYPHSRLSHSLPQSFSLSPLPRVLPVPWWRAFSEPRVTPQVSSPPLTWWTSGRGSNSTGMTCVCVPRECVLCLFQGVWWFVVVCERCVAGCFVASPTSSVN